MAAGRYAGELGLPPMEMEGGLTVELEPGDIVYYNSQFWHRGWNPDGLDRWTLHCSWHDARTPIWAPKNSRRAPGQPRRQDPAQVSSDGLSSWSPRSLPATGSKDGSGLSGCRGVRTDGSPGSEYSWGGALGAICGTASSSRVGRWRWPAAGASAGCLEGVK